MENKEYILKEKIKGPETISNYIFALITLLGGSGFLTVGISTYLKFNIIPLLDASGIVFFPQGLVMIIYGIIGIIISIYQILLIYWRIGEGYNEFDKKNNKMTIFRKGFPGENSEIKITSKLTDIESIKIEIKNELFNSKQNIYVCLKEKQDLPIIKMDNPLKINELEKKAAELSSFLQVPIKGI
uniref:Photosystem I assembly protein Ycf4 n=1 Tax=Discoplastis spathirhyncha TaxID=215771 RepID=A0A3G3LLA1_9EUGL|nr:photosystem I assembly protein ycf4 [Discoplastis spathirhyncha]AYQ93492.1 photosystem I assembly protein ycf4 [Discoplastis spathirhyncha]